ncbi:DoxX family membrane protein [Sphingosinicella sp. LHD-64]|uniref:DoxX family membrane protein n=1 Tax=Sphingosinicella sp. LHD-64 TaxID=3072139 RepID=UPI00280E64E1|nr:DoxX family membrane protein [Sphingosinicella sp. LHD-64]MDQ8758090.1 DoxX family membrane protein [Sphingosinicella sp. LHD-64]
MYNAAQADALFFGGGATWFGLPGLAALLFAALPSPLRATPNYSEGLGGKGMDAMKRYDGIILAIGTLGYGLVCLAFGNFGLQWQPVPEWVPGRTPLAYLNGAVLAVAGALLLWPAAARRTAGFLAGYILLWVLLLKLPKVLAAPLTILPWLGFAEILSLAAGALMLAALLDPTPRRAWQQVARYGYGICPIVFGLSHFAYPDFTAGMVPAWIPAPLFWAWATGAGHFAAGLAILSGVLSRLAATLLAAMMGCFVLLLHLPRVIAEPASHIEWTMLTVATMLAGAAWIIRAGITPRERSAAASGEMQIQPT